MFSLVARNRLRSVFIFGLMLVMLTAIGALSAGAYDMQHCALGALAGAAIAIISALYGYFQSSEALLESMHAQRVTAASEPALVNIVEEMVIASGLSRVPDIYVIPTMDCNAFATGRNANHAAIAVTKGLMRLLNRDELQGVIAHEISHIVHQDVLFMTLLTAMAQAASVMSEVQYFTSDSDSRDDDQRDSKDNSGGIMVVLRILVYLFGGTAARLLVMFASRTREYMADASGAIFTRNPEALACALEKLAQQQGQQEAGLPKSVEAMLTVSEQLSATHPPLQARISILRRLAGVRGVATYKAYADVYKDVTGQKASFIPLNMQSAKV